MKQRAFVVEIKDSEIALEVGKGAGEADLSKWIKRAFDVPAEEPFTRDMVLRPTTLCAGVHYLDPKDPLDATIVVIYRGQTYQQIFCEPGGTDRISQDGDLIFRDVHLASVETTAEPRPLSDPEFLALAAFVNAGVAEAQAANADRERKDQAPAYGENWFAPGVVELERELRRRGVLPS